MSADAYRKELVAITEGESPETYRLAERYGWLLAGRSLVHKSGKRPTICWEESTLAQQALDDYVEAKGRYPRALSLVID